MSFPAILVINCGSSSLKFSLYNQQGLVEICTGLADKLTSDQPTLKIEPCNPDETQEPINVKKVLQLAESGHKHAIEVLCHELEQMYSLSQSIVGVGHRVVHGGELFSASVLINQDVLDQIKACIPLAPLHNPANVMGIELMTSAFPDCPQIAVFDTSFHQTIPEHAYLYAIPFHLYEKHGIRRYGFHGTSHRYITQSCAEFINKPINELNIITAHLGNGASVAAIKAGKSVDTSMGLTPLEGLVMGTRSGDIDPGIYDYLLDLNYSPKEISNILNKESGLLGISTVSNDMRSLSELADQGDQKAQLAIEIFCFRLAKYIAAMAVSLPSIDGLVFTGGIGENASNVRSKTIQHLNILGFCINEETNKHGLKDGDCAIHEESSHPIMIIATNEEKMIARDTYNLI